jgi:hypothetical protein
MPSVFAGAFFGSALTAAGLWNFLSSSRPWPSGDADAVKPDDVVRPTSLDCRLALQLQTKFDKESNSSCEVGYDNADVIHPPNRHVPQA